MARIRTFKPDFFEDEELVDLGCAAMLLFVGLWTMADREGRLEDRPRRIRANILPYGDDDVDKLLGGLAAGGFIARYSANGMNVIQVVNFLRHQMPGRDEPASEFPAMSGEMVEYVKPPNETVRQRLYQRDGFRCAYCGDDMRNKSRSRCLDHVIPYARGGSNRETNLVTCCKKCNETKRSRTPIEAGMPWPSGLGDYADGRTLSAEENLSKNPVNGGVNGGVNETATGKDKEWEEEEGKEYLVNTKSNREEPLSSDSSGDEPSDFALEELTRRTFWTSAGKSPDPVVRALCKACYGIPKFNAVVPPGLPTVEKVVARIRRTAPHDAAILSEIELFDLYWSSQKTIHGKGQWWLSVGKWCDKQGGKWALAKRRGGLIAVPGGASKTAAEMRAEMQERARLADGGR